MEAIRTKIDIYMYGLYTKDIDGYTKSNIYKRIMSTRYTNIFVYTYVCGYIYI